MTSKRFIIWSVLLHVIVVAVLVFSVDFGTQKIAPSVAHKSDIVQAKVIDSKAVEKEVKRLQAEDDKARLEKERKAEDAERKVREAEQKRKREEQRVKELEAKQKLLKQQTEKESKRLAEAKQAAEQERKQAEQRKKDEQRELAEKKKAAEAAEAAKAAEKKKAEERAKAEQAHKEAERKRVEEALQNQIEAEEAAAEQNSADANELSKFVAAISNSVRQSFTIQPGLEGLSCTLRVTFIPGGEVAGVEVIKSSGNPLFDRQAENAVRKAAPLPVPSDPRLFQKMRSIAFVFRP